mgnify:CR=1 FL=1
MISYSDNSIVDISDIQALAEKRYDVLIEKVELSHSKQGRSSISKVDEYIFICRPKEIVHDVDEKLSVIKELKPIVDNPAGFMMCRTEKSKQSYATSWIVSAEKQPT